MSKTFTYKEENKQGWLVEKPEMEKPDDNNFYEPDYEEPSRVWFDSDSRNRALKEYNQYLTSLRRFKYDYPDPGKEMELGKDFEVIQDENGLGKVAIPITQRTYSEQDLLDVWDAASDWQMEYNLAAEWGNTDNVDAPDKEQYFKQKFSIEL